MRIEIYPYGTKIDKRDGVIYLNDRDFNNYGSFFAAHSEIAPESVDEVFINGVLETHPYPAILLRTLDWLIKLNGTVEFHFISCNYTEGFRTPWRIKSLISLPVLDRWINIVAKEENGHILLKYQKISASLPQDDSLEKWSFGIISNGSQNERTVSLIDSIIKQGIPSLEILVCGPAPSQDLPECVKVIDESDCYQLGDIRAPISKKKNKIVSCAMYNNLCILHDRFLLPRDWYESMRRYGNYFDAITPMVFNVEKHDHITDSINAWDGRVTDFYGYYRTPETIVMLQSIMKQPSRWPGWLYLNGGIFITKKHIYQRVSIPDQLNWAEAEDIVWCQHLQSNGYLVGIDINNCVYTSCHRISSIKYQPHPSLLQQLKKNRFVRGKQKTVLRKFGKEYGFTGYRMRYAKVLFDYYLLSLIAFLYKKIL